MSDAQEFGVIIHPLDDGSQWAEVDGLPGCLTQGKNYSQILAHVRDAHEFCCEALAIPSPAPAAIPDAAALGKVITTGDLARLLDANGWQIVATGQHHAIYRAADRPECISVLTAPETALVPALVSALIKILA
jgi:predicted RNase H-like HicB family nuclease/predicted RNA binding protein YcfA (HicA-like mRNA interferase family)